jgi:hypothetical protein
MEITLGPWKAEKGISKDMAKPLTEAMGDEARRTVKRTEGFEPREAPVGETKSPGFQIFGKLVKLTQQGRTSEVKAQFNVNVDGYMANVATVEGKASATAPMTAEDALRAVVESRVKALLEAIQAGRVRRQG